MMTLKKRRIILVVCVLVFLLLIPLVLLYTTGFRWDSKLGLYKTGGLYISSPLTDSKIFINNNLEKETNILQSGIFLQSLKPGEYSVLVAKDGYWPWQKNLIVKEQLVTEARAMLIFKEPKGTIILRENYSPLETSKYDEILANIKALRQPLKPVKTKQATTTPEEISRYTRFTANQKEKLWWDPKTNKIWVEWLAGKESLPYFFCDDSVCNEKMLIHTSRFSITNIDFYPKRRDVVLFAAQNGVYAIEIDGRGGNRTIQRVYKGKEPIFTTYKNDNSIYILEEDKLIEIKL